MSDTRSDRVTITLPRWLAALRDPGIVAIVVLLALVGSGFAAFAIGWRGVAKQIYVPLQLPFFVSAGLGGLAVIGLALASWSIHLERRQNAADAVAMAEIVRNGCEWAEQLRRGKST